MEKHIDLDRFRTDLAIEKNDFYKNDDIDGVSVENRFYENDTILETIVNITNEHGSHILGKPVGEYITISSSALKDGDANVSKKVCDVLTKALRAILDIENKTNILIVGLGNKNVTVDALGSKVTEKILVTRHFYDEAKNSIKGIRKVSVITPSVVGKTGIETLDIVKNVAKEVNPDVLIVIDALCARSVDKINTTIQITNTGITPGSGVNNKRLSINRETIGVDVIAIGIPTVVEAKTIVYDTLMSFFDKTNENIYETSLSKGEKHDIIQKVLKEASVEMIVAPKEVDEIIIRLSSILSKCLNRVLHDGLTDEEIAYLLY